MAADQEAPEVPEVRPAAHIAAPSRGFFSSLIHAPMDLVTGGVTGLFKGILGAGKGFFSNTFGNLFGWLTTTGVIVGLTQFAPSAVKYVSDLIGKVHNGKTIAEIYADDKAKGGMARVVMDAGLAAVLINGTAGVASGLIGSTADSSEGSEKSAMEKLGGMLASGGVIAGLGFLAFTHIRSTQVGTTTPSPTAPLTPPATPKPSAATPAIPTH